MKYIIEGYCHEIKYWLQLKPLEYGKAPEFLWNGLINNATHFDDIEKANKAFSEVHPYSKLPMEIKSA